MKKGIGVAVLAVVAAFGGAPAVLAEAETREESEIAIPLKTKYAPQETEVILGFDTSHSGTREKWVSELELEYSLLDRIEFDLELPFVARFPDTEANQYGVGDVETGIKMKLYKSEDEDLHLAGGMGVTWPSGDVSKEIGEGKTELGPFLATAKAFGPLSLLTAFAYERVVTTRGEEAAAADKNGYKADGAVAYTFPSGWSPLLEVNSVFETLNIVSLTPGIIYAAGDHLQARAGVQVPVTSDREFRWNAVFQLLYDFY
ncbi:MAG: transporter [Deltaproteobacteria bacterium]|nr:transporter [Deltaproteobacteria bacterium]MBI4224162.1 transporter [Deltaproteobacteria bacterium]